MEQVEKKCSVHHGLTLLLEIGHMIKSFIIKRNNIQVFRCRLTCQHHTIVVTPNENLQFYQLQFGILVLCQCHRLQTINHSRSHYHLINFSFTFAVISTHSTQLALSCTLFVALDGQPQI